MKKTLLLSVVASTMIMAGGDIAPVEPVVETPVVAEASGWDFSGQGVVYYQTIDAFGAQSLFDQASSVADAGIQLKAVNKDVFAGIGFGATLNGLATLNLENYLVSNTMQRASGDTLQGGWIGELYVTYGLGDTSVKLGRQTLPQSLSPFAYSENWNVFENTYDAALVVNSSIPDTTLVYAWVYNANQNGYPQLRGTILTPDNGGNMGDFGRPGAYQKGIHMVTAQNKSISNLTLTGSWYYGQDLLGSGNNLSILWGDAAYDAGSFNVAVQGGQISPDTLKDTTAFGAKIGASFAGINAHIAYSTVDDGDVSMLNVGGQQTSLYTQMIINEAFNSSDNDTVVVAANTNLLGGTFGAAYGMTTDNSAAGLDYNELDVYYAADMLGGNYLVGYVNMDADAHTDSNNVVRVVARYNF